MLENNSIINREASDKSKGFRLQKIRMIELFLDAIEKQENITLYGAVELIEDIYLQTGTKDTSKTILEEDKNYDKQSSFSANHTVVLNTLVSFVDIWFFKMQQDPNVRFVFYSTNSISKERTTNFIKELNLSIPDKKILKSLQEKKELDKDTLDLLKNNIIQEYKAQYENKEDHKEHIKVVEKIEDESWRDFFKQIDWHFNKEDHKELKQKVLKKIKASRLFNISHNGYEETIFNAIIEKIDEKQTCKNYTDRLVTYSDIENVFLRAEKGRLQNTTDDFVWKQWTSLSPPETRNLIEKIKAVSKDYSSKGIDAKTLKAGRGIQTAKDFERDKNFLSLKYRVFEVCAEKLSEMEINTDISEKEINLLIKTLVDLAFSSIEELKNSYNYSHFNSKDIVEGIVYELFDSCYIAFD